MIAEGGSANLLIQSPMISSLSSLIKKKQRTASNEMVNGHLIYPSEMPGVNGLKGPEQQLHAERFREIFHREHNVQEGNPGYKVDTNRNIMTSMQYAPKAYDILTDEMMDIEGVLDEEVWEARVMSDPTIVFSDLVSPGDEEVWAELEKQKDEAQKDIDGYERLHSDGDGGSRGNASGNNNRRCQYDFDSMLLADEFLAEELREQEDHVKEVEEQQKGWDMNSTFPEEEVWNDLRIDMELEVQENEERLK
ncbi:MAG: hypothetical protein BYD32DRAFT_447611 [Podila humilis]|nr:MAG: hypothetical protein BYD32DRAFT_447611 [Podila humilis]